MRLALVVVLAVGCSSSESTPTPVVDAATDTFVTATDTAADTSPADARDAACTLVKPYSSKDTDCNACAQEKCCADVNACLGDKRCDDDYVNCILACALLPSDAADAGAEVDRCVAECGTMHPEGKQAYDAAIGCVEARCVGVCD